MNVLVVTNMYPTPGAPAFGTFVADQVAAVQRAGVAADVLFVDGRRNRSAYLQGGPRLWSRLQRGGYDLIHAHHFLAGLVARMQLSLPIVTTYHGGEVGPHVPAWLRTLARLGPRIFDRVITVNSREAAILNRPNVRVIPCGVDLELFRPHPRAEARARLGLPAGAALVLWAGEHWQREKRVDLVREAMALLGRDLPDAQLVLVSGRPHEEIPWYMSACDALVLASSSEGSPMVVKEAMACNLPVVSTDVGDVGEIIAGVDGCALAAPDAADLADKLRITLARNARTQGRGSVAGLSSERIAQRVIGVYRELGGDA